MGWWATGLWPDMGSVAEKGMNTLPRRGTVAYTLPLNILPEHYLVIWAEISGNTGVYRYRRRSAQPAVHRDGRLLLRQASGAGERHLDLRHRHWNIRLRTACQLFRVRIRLESRSACQRNHSCHFEPELTIDHVTHRMTGQWPKWPMTDVNHDSRHVTHDLWSTWPITRDVRNTISIPIPPFPLVNSRFHSHSQV